MTGIRYHRNRHTYLAAPFFNERQIEIVERAQNLLMDRNHTFYSPRIHSGSLDFTPEQRRNPTAWDPVMDSNISHLYTCKLLLAFLEYPMPEGHKLCVERPDSTGARHIHPVSGFPDTGVTFEVGHAYCMRMNRPDPYPAIYGVMLEETSRVNLMLAKAVDGIIRGWEMLERFLLPDNGFDPSVVTRYEGGII